MARGDVFVRLFLDLYESCHKFCMVKASAFLLIFMYTDALELGIANNPLDYGLAHKSFMNRNG